MDAEPRAPYTIDLNADVGEGFGPYVCGDDGELLGIVSSASVACGFHAGDPAAMRRAVRLALGNGVAVGAHPGLPDRLGFGRRAMEVTPDEAYEMVLYQIGALDAFIRAEGGRMSHVKAHGALYNMAARDAGLARAVAGAVRDYDPRLLLYGLSGSRLIEAGEEAGLRAVSEAFADRRYLRDGSLAPRTLPGSVLNDPGEAARQAVRLAVEGTVVTLEGESLHLRAETICIHGDTPDAAATARAILRHLRDAGIEVRSPHPVIST